MSQIKSNSEKTSLSWKSRDTISSERLEYIRRCILEATSQIISSTPTIEELIRFREITSKYFAWIIILLETKTDSRWFHCWFETNITMLQNIYRKLFPYYNEVVAWHCLIWSTPDYTRIRYIDFPWEFAIMNFLIKFKAELDGMPNYK